MKWYFRVLKKYAVFSGRAHRTEYWMFFFFNFIVLFFLVFFEQVIQPITSAYQNLFSTIYIWATFIPWTAVGWRRMHDTNRSGCWSLVPIISLIFFLEEGTEGTNKFGSEPPLFY